MSNITIEELMQRMMEVFDRVGSGSGGGGPAPDPKGLAAEMNLLQKASKQAAEQLAKEKAEREKTINSLKSGFNSLENAISSATKAYASGNASFTTMADAVSGAAKAVSSFASILGPAGAVLGKAFEAAAAANGMMVQQFQLGYDAFKKMSSSGLVSNFDQLRDMSAKTGVRMEQMAEVLTPLSKDLSRLGGAQGGLSQLSKLGEASKNLRSSFYEMGINAKEFMEYQAEYITQGKMNGSTKGLSEKQLVEGTRQYIEQLDSLTKLTGMSRKEAQDARKSIEGDDRYRAIMADANSNQKSGMKDALVTIGQDLGPEMAKGAQHAMSGVFNTPEAKAFLLQTGGNTGMMTDLMEKMKNAETPEERTKLITELRSQYKAGLESTEETRRGLAAVGVGGVMGGGYAKTSNYLNSDQASAEDIQAQKAQNRSGTSKELGQAQEMMDRTSLNFQQMATESKVAVESIKLMASMFDKSVQAAKGAIEAYQEMSDSGKNTVLTLGGFAASLLLAKGVMDKFFGAESRGSPTNPMFVVDMSAGMPGGGPGGKGPGKGPMGSGSKIAQAAKGVAKGGALAVAGVGAEMAGDYAASKGHEQVGAGLKTVGTAAQYAGMGAMIGSVVPGVGTAIGAGVGAAIGLGKGLYDNWGEIGSRDYEKYIQWGGESGSRTNFEQLDPEFRGRVINAAKQYFEATGKKIQINSAYRDPEKQKELHDKWIAGGKQGKPVAEPGKSLHNVGAAVDIQNYQDAEAVKAFNAQGLSQKVPNDPVHFQARTGGIFKGPSTGYQVELHGEEAVVPMNDGVSKQAMNNSIFNQDSNGMAKVAEALAAMAEKYDTMIELLEDANGHHKKLVQAAA